MQPRISTARTNRHPNFPLGLHPPLLHRIPNRHIIPGQMDRHARRLARGNDDVAEPFQNRRRLASRHGVVQV